MELFERVKKLAKALAGTDKALAEGLGLKQNTFSGYLNQERQDNLWPLLPQILALYPRLSRQWLYFEEGPMTIGLGVALDQPVPPMLVLEADRLQRQSMEAQVASLTDALAEAQAKLVETEAELREAYRTNQRLTTRLLVDGAGDKSDATNTDNKVVGGQG